MEDRIYYNTYETHMGFWKCEAVDGEGRFILATTGDMEDAIESCKREAAKLIYKIKTSGLETIS